SWTTPDVGGSSWTLTARTAVETSGASWAPQVSRASTPGVRDGSPLHLPPQREWLPPVDIVDICRMEDAKALHEPHPDMPRLHLTPDQVGLAIPVDVVHADDLRCGGGTWSNDRRLPDLLAGDQPPRP